MHIDRVACMLSIKIMRWGLHGGRKAGTIRCMEYMDFGLSKNAINPHLLYVY